MLAFDECDEHLTAMEQILDDRAQMAEEKLKAIECTLEKNTAKLKEQLMPLRLSAFDAHLKD